MNTEQNNIAIKMYGEEKMFFSHYYKYSFTYKDESGDLIYRNLGDSGNIYRSEFSPEMTLDELLDECSEGDVYYKGELIYSLE